MIDVLYLHVKHLDWQQASIANLEFHLLNKGNIFTLEPNQTIFQFLKNTQTTQNLMIIEQNMGFLKDTNIENIPITYEIENSNYIHDHIKPQIINKNNFLTLEERYYQYPLNRYFQKIQRIGLPNNIFTVHVNKPVCCTTKSLLKTKQYVTWNQKSFQSVKKYLTF